MVGNNLKKEYILITSSNFPDGGAGANYLNLFCKGLKSDENNVKVFLLKGYLFGNFKTTHKKNNFTSLNIPFTYLGLINRPKNEFKKVFDDLLVILNLIINLFLMLPKRKKITLLIYNNEIQTNIIIYFFSKLFGIKLVTIVPEFYDKQVFEGSFFRKLKWYGFLFNFSFLNKLSYKLIVFSYYLKDQYLKQGYKEQNIIIQPNLTDFDYWEVKQVQKKYAVGFSGSPSIKDGLHDLFKAISLLKKRGTSLSLLIIGDTLNGESLIPDLEKECEILSIKDNVSFAGLVELPMVKKLLAECSILALTRPSTIQTQAGFPTKLGEYFASKDQVLVTNFGDIEKYFKAGEEVVMAETENVIDIADKIQWMIDNKEAAEKIRATGYIKATLLLEYKSSLKRIVEFIN